MPRLRVCEPAWFAVVSGAMRPILERTDRSSDDGVIEGIGARLTAMTAHEPSGEAEPSMEAETEAGPVGEPESEPESEPALARSAPSLSEDEEITGELLKEPGLADEWIRQNTLIYGGLIGLGVVLVQPYLAAGDPPLAGLIAVVAFAVAIPLLAMLMLLASQEAYRHRASRSAGVGVARAVAMGAACIGTVAAFWQISWIAGVAIVVSGAVAIGVHSAGYVRLEPEMMRRAEDISLRRMAARRRAKRSAPRETKPQG